jgi:hypothetical protein
MAPSPLLGKWLVVVLVPLPLPLWSPPSIARVDLTMSLRRGEILDEESPLFLAVPTVTLFWFDTFGVEDTHLV